MILVLLVSLVFPIGGCSSSGKSSVALTPTGSRSTTNVGIQPPQPPQEDLIDDELPVMEAIEKSVPHLKYEQKRYNLDLQSGDIKDVLLALIKDTDIGIIIDPGIAGTIPVMDLKDATLSAILSYILPPLKLKYKWEGKNLHIFKDPMVTRYFRLDYISATRKGTRQVSFSTRSNSGGASGMGGSGSGGSGGSSGGSGSGGSGGSGGAGGGGGSNQSSSDISIDYMNTIWDSFIESLKVLVFGSLENARSAQSSQSGSSEQSGSSQQGASKNTVKTFTYSDPSGKALIINPDTGVVVVKAFEDDIDSVAKFIEKFEGSAQRQVWIEAKIIEVNLYKGYQMGIDWGAIGGDYGILPNKRTLIKPAATFTPGSISSQVLGSSGAFQFAVSNGVLDVMLDAISRQGNMKVLASPRISTLNNEKATIRAVREEAFFSLQTQISQGLGGNISSPTINVQVVPIGVVMDIIPQIGENGEIMLSINPDISELLEIRKFDSGSTGTSGPTASATQPVIDRRSIDTTAKLKDGQTLVIAGIIKEKKNETIKGVPFLYKIPLLGNLFRRTEQEIERTELVILITPRIHSGKSAQQLTEDERQRVKDAVKPMKLGDVAEVDEGLTGELSSFKKEKPQKNRD